MTYANHAQVETNIDSWQNLMLYKLLPMTFFITYTAPGLGIIEGTQMSPMYILASLNLLIGYVWVSVDLTRSSLALLI